MNHATNSPYIVIKATKVEKKSIMRFYNTEHYPASYIGQDHCYIVKAGNVIIASAIVSAGQESSNFWLLHALVTSKAHRRRNIASFILQTIVSEKNSQAKFRYEKLICFADIALQEFYLTNHFINYNIRNDIAKLPEEFRQRLTRYRVKQRDLQCFILRRTVKLV